MYSKAKCRDENRSNLKEITQTAVTNTTKKTHVGKENSFNLTFCMFKHTSSEVTV